MRKVASRITTYTHRKRGEKGRETEGEKREREKETRGEEKKRREREGGKGVPAKYADRRAMRAISNCAPNVEQVVCVKKPRFFRFPHQYDRQDLKNLSELRRNLSELRKLVRPPCQS